MAVFRVEKTKDFTVMSNHHLRNKELSLKAKGLLSVMLGLPDSWNYTLNGLASISKEKVDAIRTTINELEKAGYIERHRIRNEKGQLKESEYIIHEQPILDTPILENPTLDKPISENPTQLNTYKSSNKKSKTNSIKYTSINPVVQSESEERWIDRYNKTVSSIKEQIDYDTLIYSNNAEIIDEIVNVITEVMLIDVPYYKIEGKSIPAAYVRINYGKITFDKLEAFLLEFNKIYHKIKNPKAYLITALFNIASTAETALINRVNNDMYEGCRKCC